MKSRLFVSLLVAAGMVTPMAAVAADVASVGAGFGAPLPWLHGCCRVDTRHDRGQTLVVAPGLVALSANGWTVASSHGIGLWLGQFDITAHGPMVRSPRRPDPRLSAAELMHLGALTQTRSGRLRPYGMVCRGPLGQPTTCRLMTMADAGHYEAQRFLASGGLPAGLTRHQADELRAAWKRDRHGLPPRRPGMMSTQPRTMAAAMASPSNRAQRRPPAISPPQQARPDRTVSPCEGRTATSQRCRDSRSRQRD